ncbi:MAG: hypothetical protein ACFB3T_11565 [Geminicoccaceae bacterium]
MTKGKRILTETFPEYAATIATLQRRDTRFSQLFEAHRRTCSALARHDHAGHRRPSSHELEPMQRRHLDLLEQREANLRHSLLRQIHAHHKRTKVTI